MKKRNSIFAAMLLVAALMLSACGGGTSGGGDPTPNVKEQTPYEIYSLASEKMEALESMHMVGTVDYVMEMAGETIPYSMYIDAKISSDLAMEMDFTTSMNFDGTTQEIPMKMILVDNILYLDMSELYGMKITLPFEGLIDDLMESTTGSFSSDFVEADFEGATVREENGGYVITMSISGETMDSLTGDMLDQLYSAMGLSDVGEMTVGDVSYELGVDASGMLTTMDMILDMTMEVYGEELTMSAKMFMEITDLGKDFTITAPADAADYLDGESMGLTADDLI